MEAFLMNLAIRPERIVFSYVILVFLCFLIARFADYLAWSKLYVVTCFISDISNASCSTPR